MSIKALLSNSYLSVTNVIIFVGTKLLLNYARPKVSESLKTEELLLLLTLSRSHFRPIGINPFYELIKYLHNTIMNMSIKNISISKYQIPTHHQYLIIAKQFEKENIPVSDYSNHSDLSATYIYPPDAFNDSNNPDNGDPNDESEQNPIDDMSKHAKSSMNDEEYISCEEGDIPLVISLIVEILLSLIIIIIIIVLLLLRMMIISNDIIMITEIAVIWMKINVV